MSIIFVACEIVHVREGRRGLTEQWPWIVRVEIGQLLFIAAVLGAMALGKCLVRQAAISEPSWAWRIAPYSIGGVAAFWMIQRIAGF